MASAFPTIRVMLRTPCTVWDQTSSWRSKEGRFAPAMPRTAKREEITMILRLPIFFKAMLPFGWKPVITLAIASLSVSASLGATVTAHIELKDSRELAVRRDRDRSGVVAWL